MARALRSTLIVALAALAFTGVAQASGGNYVVDGGTAAEQGQVRSALNASSFNWSLVPTQVAIHIGRGIYTSYSTPGQIWLDANLLDAGTFSWGVVQMEYAHQVHFSLLNDQMRADLTTALGAKAWCWEVPGLTHADNGCERFSATLAWAYWPSKSNSMQPQSPSDESAAMAPAKFRALLAQLLGERSLAAVRAPR